MSLVEYTTPTAPVTPTGNHWVDLVAPAAELAKSIANTEFVPTEMRGNPAVVAACILYGAEIGIGPMMALAKVDIVKGRPAPKAELARALALSAGHEVWVVEATNTKCTVAGKRRGSDHEQRVTWTLDDVKKAGIVNQNYSKYPRQMLLARASAELVRQMCPDALGGIGQFAEELDGDTDAPAIAGTPVQATTGNRRARMPLSLPSGPMEAPLLPGEEDGSAEPPPAATEQPKGDITDAQMRKVQALLNEHGYTERTKAIGFVSDTIGRAVASRNELSKAEAAKVIDALEAVPA